jgi:hypothetical protein
MNDVGYYTFLDEVTTDPIYRCSYYRCMTSLGKLQHRTITKIGKQTKIQGIAYMYIRSNVIPSSLSLNRCVFYVATESVYIASKGSSSIKLWKVIIW